jgi:hypothetical protein
VSERERREVRMREGGRGKEGRREGGFLRERKEE